MVRSRLAFKISVLIVVVLIVGFGASTILTIQRESALLVEQSKMAARRLTATLVASIEGAMLQERPDVTRIGTPGAEDLHPGRRRSTVFRRNGVEAFTDLATAMEVNKNAGLAKDVMDNIRKMAAAARRRRPPGPCSPRRCSRSAPRSRWRLHNGATFFTLHHPILNQEKCQGCHGSDHKVRAVVRVATSMEPVLRPRCGGTATARS